MTARDWRNAILFGLAACSAPAPAGAADPVSGAPVARAGAAVPDDSLPQFQDLFDPLPSNVRRPGPDWIRRTSSAVLERYASASDDWHLAVQQERSDGADLFTIRHPLPSLGPLQTYAGAGLNRTVYYAETDLGQTGLSHHNRHRAMGATAELGAELPLSERLRMRADLRWIDLATDASILRSGDALVGADPVAVGLAVGWRFP
jgi:hypothetical protein